MLTYFDNQYYCPQLSCRCVAIYLWLEPRKVVGRYGVGKRETPTNYGPRNTDILQCARKKILLYIIIILVYSFQPQCNECRLFNMSF